ncbi:glutathione synthase [Inhella gelatinilytica]|uniref:Glutathione synthetase n=1 Tax=Inhella gelatinilytica TaxID=2795030 RepID=A0A931IX41_9BURK|nr:glutathione synthase [Inhella gelatinilytica]MBH9551633.1 glutathione synthase [Inhella gelatinilytica]
MDLLFIIDPLDHIKTHKDSSFAMMREAARRGHGLWVCETHQLVWQHGDRVTARGAQRLQLSGEAVASAYGSGLKDWWQAPITRDLPLASVDAVLMRKDPPFDAEFIYATHLLSQAEREGARVFNRPSALREHPEKLSLMEFPQWTAPTLVSRDAEVLRAFHAEQRDVIFKPLDGMGGMGIFRVREDGLNLGAILEQLTHYGAQTIMAQRYLPEISEGDKRVLVIDGVPVSHALARIPQGGEVRGNLAAGGRGVAMPLTAREREAAEALGPILAARGLLLVGLDLIGGFVTEINVTSPTCFQEISAQAGLDVAATFLDAVERRIA